MVRNEQVKVLREMRRKGFSVEESARASGMSENTARKYLSTAQMPEEMKRPRTWRTRRDPFGPVWEEVKELLEANPGLQAKTVFGWLQEQHPGRFADGQLRTLQRRIKQWRALEGPAREVFFPQEHRPGLLCQSDFTDMSRLGVSIQGQPFEHMLYHFVLTYSNWESVSICFSESFEALSTGLQDALIRLGAVPQVHQTDRLSAAVQKVESPELFTERYQALLDHYGLQGRPIQAGRANENGDVEKSHDNLKKALDQKLMLRGSRDFSSRADYRRFLGELVSERNAGRLKRLQEEREVLRPLPLERLPDYKQLDVRVGPSSTITVQKNTYTVHSRLIGELVRVRLYADHLEIWYAQQQIDTMPRLRGDGKHQVNYRHIIDWLVRKPGAFENYRYRSDLFPSSRFRVAWDWLQEHLPSRAAREYVQILHCAAREGEAKTDDALRFLIETGSQIVAEDVREIVLSREALPAATDVAIAPVDLGGYDTLLSAGWEVSP